uniref:exodeoxyribonuclease III n=1 Tax=Haplochromis burtoni TaxID=8153 RepID=A0A3Q3BYN0_HAPBU
MALSVCLGLTILRRKIISLLKKDRVQIALLQETHLTDSEHLKLKRDWVGQIYYSSFNSKSRGVAILVHKNLPFTLHTIVRDTDGRFILITGLLYGELILLGSVYAPNTFDRSFYSNFLAKTSPVCPNHVIIGGDFNCGLNPETDYNPPKSQPSSKMAKATTDLCSDLGLFDAWRVCNPHVKDFTFFSRPHFSFSRIDYILFLNTMLNVCVFPPPTTFYFLFIFYFILFIVSLDFKCGTLYIFCPRRVYW